MWIIIWIILWIMNDSLGIMASNGSLRLVTIQDQTIKFVMGISNIWLVELDMFSLLDTISPMVSLSVSLSRIDRITFWFITLLSI